GRVRASRALRSRYPAEQRGKGPSGPGAEGASERKESVGASPPRDDGRMPDELDDVDRELLNAVQWDFPLVARPFADLGERLGMSEPEVRERVQRVKDAGVLRQLSAIFDTRALGYNSALVAAKVDADTIDDAAAAINEHPGISHNYKRNHEYNLWYTV